MGCNCGGSVRQQPRDTAVRQPRDAQRATHLAKPPAPRAGGGPGDPDGGYYAPSRHKTPAA